MPLSAPKAASWRKLLAAASALVAVSTPLSGYAQTASDFSEVIRRLDEQDAALRAQQAEIARQRDEIESQRLEIQRLRRIDPREAQDLRGGGAIAQPQDQEPSRAEVTPTPRAPVGEAPPPTPPPVVAALPEGVGVLTGTDKAIFETTIDYSRASSNRLVFRGVELAPGLPFGVFEVSDADRNTASVTFAARTGLTKRLEIEARVPFVWRDERIALTRQRDETVTRIRELSDSGLGDAELTLRYQLNRQYRRNVPFTVASLRVKSDTGKGPYEIDRDAAGVANELATGSGFWGVEPGVSFLLPSEEGAIVLYGGASYLFHFERDVNKVGADGVRIGRVDPGDSLGLNFGYGFAVNPQFSSSMGYRHNVIFETETELNGTTQNSETLQVGVVALGMSYRVSPRVTLSTSVDIGVTDDAPDVRVALRVPITIGRK